MGMIRLMANVLLSCMPHALVIVTLDVFVHSPPWRLHLCNNYVRPHSTLLPALCVPPFYLCRRALELLLGAVLDWSVAAQLQPKVREDGFAWVARPIRHLVNA